MMDEMRTKDLIGFKITDFESTSSGSRILLEKDGQHRSLECLGGDFGVFGAIKSMEANEDRRLIGFWLDDKPNDDGCTLYQILRWDRKKLESNHSYIQWLCPTYERSKPNPRAPVLTDSIVAQLKAGAGIGLQLAFETMMSFYGIDLGGSDGLDLKRVLGEMEQDWLYPANHNYLRLTRILKFAKIFNLQVWGLPTGFPAADRLMQVLEAVAAKWPDLVGSSIEFWRQA